VNTIDKIRQESPINSKGNARQRCMFEGPLRTKSAVSSPIRVTDIGYDVFIYARWRHRLAWLLPFERPNASILKGVPKFDAPYGEFLERRRAKFKLVKTTFNCWKFLTQAVPVYF